MLQSRSQILDVEKIIVAAEGKRVVAEGKNVVAEGKNVVAEGDGWCIVLYKAFGIVT